MENNILQTLSSLLGKGQSQTPQTQSPPLYPVEAYSQIQSSQPVENGQNNFLPLLLALAGQNGGNEALTKLLSQEQTGDIASLLSLFSNLPKKKKIEKQEQKKEEQNLCIDGALPENQIL